MNPEGPLTTEQREDAKGLACAALACARRDDGQGATAAVLALLDRYGAVGIGVLLLGLADTVIRSQGGARRPGQVVMPVFADTSLGAVGLADDVVPRVLWAGRFIAARAADDRAACEALIGSCANDAEFFDHISALLEVAAETLNQASSRPRSGQ